MRRRQRRRDSGPAGLATPRVRKTQIRRSSRSRAAGATQRLHLFQRDLMPAGAPPQGTGAPPCRASRAGRWPCEQIARSTHGAPLLGADEKTTRAAPRCGAELTTKSPAQIRTLEPPAKATGRATAQGARSSSIQRAGNRKRAEEKAAARARAQAGRQAEADADCLERAAECAEALLPCQGSSACESTRQIIDTSGLAASRVCAAGWECATADQEPRSSRISFAVPLPLQHRIPALASKSPQPSDSGSVAALTMTPGERLQNAEPASKREKTRR